MIKSYEMKEYEVTIHYHTQRTNLIAKYKASGNNEEVAKRLCLGSLLMAETKRYIKLDDVIAKEL